MLKPLWFLVALDGAGTRSIHLPHLLEPLSLVSETAGSKAEICKRTLKDIKGNSTSTDRACVDS